MNMFLERKAHRFLVQEHVPDFRFCDDDVARMRRIERQYSFLSSTWAEEARSCEQLIEEAVSASTTDMPQQHIGNTLEDANSNIDRFWSSTGSDATCEEWLLYRLKHPLCKIQFVKLAPYRAYFQRGEPLYPPVSISFEVGGTPDNMQQVSIKYTVQLSDKVQVFAVPPTACAGQYLRVRLHDKQQMQLDDMRYYAAIRFVAAYGYAVPAEDAVQQLRGWRSLNPASNTACLAQCCHQGATRFRDGSGSKARMPTQSGEGTHVCGSKPCGNSEGDPRSGYESTDADDERHRPGHMVYYASTGIDTRNSRSRRKATRPRRVSNCPMSDDADSPGPSLPSSPSPGRSNPPALDLPLPRESSFWRHFPGQELLMRINSRQGLMDPPGPHQQQEAAERPVQSQWRFPPTGMPFHMSNADRLLLAAGAADHIPNGMMQRLQGLDARQGPFAPHVLRVREFSHAPATQEQHKSPYVKPLLVELAPGIHPHPVTDWEVTACEGERGWETDESTETGSMEEWNGEEN